MGSSSSPRPREPQPGPSGALRIKGRRCLSFGLGRENLREPRVFLSLLGRLPSPPRLLRGGLGVGKRGNVRLLRVGCWEL